MPEDAIQKLVDLIGVAPGLAGFILGWGSVYLTLRYLLPLMGVDLRTAADVSKLRAAVKDLEEEVVDLRARIRTLERFAAPDTHG